MKKFTRDYAQRIDVKLKGPNGGDSPRTSLSIHRDNRDTETTSVQDCILLPKLTAQTHNSPTTKAYINNTEKERNHVSFHHTLNSDKVHIGQ